MSVHYWKRLNREPQEPAQQWTPSKSTHLKPGLFAYSDIGLLPIVRHLCETVIQAWSWFLPSTNGQVGLWPQRGLHGDLTAKTKAADLTGVWIGFQEVLGKSPVHLAQIICRKAGKGFWNQNFSPVEGSRQWIFSENIPSNPMQDWKERQKSQHLIPGWEDGWKSRLVRNCDLSGTGHTSEREGAHARRTDSPDSLHNNVVGT